MHITMKAKARNQILGAPLGPLLGMGWPCTLLSQRQDHALLAFGDSWVAATTTDFRASGATQEKHWPFASTKVKELNSGALLINAGRLNAEDPSNEVVLAFGAVKAAVPACNAQGTSSIDKPAITNI